MRLRNDGTETEKLIKEIYILREYHKRSQPNISREANELN